MGAGLALAAGRLAAMISPLIYEAVVIWTGTYLVFFLLMATMCVSNLYMVDLLPEINGLQSDSEVMPINKGNPERIQNANESHVTDQSLTKSQQDGTIDGTFSTFSTGLLRTASLELIKRTTRVLFVEKAIFACPLPGKAWIELGRWNPVSLLFLVPAWSYQVSGPADHWSANNMYFYAAQFCMDESGKNHVTGSVYLGLPGAVASGLQYPEANCWLAREWAPCRKPRAKRDLDRLLMSNPSAQIPYSWMDNNCQHFAVNLYEGDHGHIA
eukprot:g24557.t1